jgi:hypothetical protein
MEIILDLTRARGLFNGQCYSDAGYCGTRTHCGSGWQVSSSSVTLNFLMLIWNLVIKALDVAISCCSVLDIQ